MSRTFRRHNLISDDEFAGEFSETDQWEMSHVKKGSKLRDQWVSQTDAGVEPKVELDFENHAEEEAAHFSGSLNVNLKNKATKHVNKHMQER